MATKEVKVIGQYDTESGWLTFPETAVNLTPGSTDPPPEPEEPEVPLPFDSFMLHLTDMSDDVILMFTPRAGHKARVYRGDEAHADYQVIGEAMGGEYRDNTPSRGREDKTLYYTITAVRLSDNYESTGADAQSIVIPKLPDIPPIEQPEPPEVPDNPLPPGGGQIELIEMHVSYSTVTVRFKPFPGAKDHWIYPIGNSLDRKAVGTGGDIAQWNGPIEGGKVVIEALDKPAPYMPHIAAHHHPMDGAGLNVINGQGPTNSVPNVVARSVEIPVTYKRKPPDKAGRVFLHYDDSTVITRSDDGDTKLSWEQIDGKCRFFANACNVPWTDVFVGKQHLMVDISDGPSTTYPEDIPLHAVKHQSNSAVCQAFSGEWDISGGKYLHGYFEWDARLDEKLRRWLKFIVYKGGDEILWLPNIDEAFLGHENLKHTSTNDFFLFRVDGQATTAIRVRPNQNGQPTPKRTEEWSHWSWNRIEATGISDRGGPPNRNIAYKDGRTMNGTNDSAIDVRHGFEFYISEDHQVFYEIDALGYRQKQQDLRNPLGLGNKIKVATSFHAYHLDLGRRELVGSNYLHWQNNTPYNHVYHGDDIVIETVAALPD